PWPIDLEDVGNRRKACSLSANLMKSVSTLAAVPPVHPPGFFSCPRSVRPAPQDVADPHHWVVLAVGDSFLQRDQCVVGDLDVLGADLGAALGDVAHAEAVIVLC